MEIFGVCFAPLCIPINRRMETLSAFTIMFLLTYFFLVSFIISFILMFTKLWWLMVIYIIWIVMDRDIGNRGGRPSKWIQSLKVFHYARCYYPVSVTIAPGLKLDPRRNYLACSFPHGNYPTGAGLSLGHDTPERRKVFSNHIVHPATLNINFYVPFYREFILALGMCNAKRKTLDSLLQTPGGGKVVLLVVGGAAESQYAYDGKYHLVLKNRKGFTKVALENGSPIIPLFSFGETSLFKQIIFPEDSLVRQFQEWFKRKTGIAPNISYGRGIFQYTFGIFPFRHPLDVVVGRPIEVKKIEKPTQEDIDRLHQEFIKALTDLFEEHKHKFEKDPENTSLIIL